LDQAEADSWNRIKFLFAEAATWQPAEDGSFLPLAELLKELSGELWSAGFGNRLTKLQSEDSWEGDIAFDLPHRFATIHLTQLDGIAPDVVAEKLKPDAEAYGLNEMQLHWLRIARELGFDDRPAGKAAANGKRTKPQPGRMKHPFTTQRVEAYKSYGHLPTGEFKEQYRKNHPEDTEATKGICRKAHDRTAEKLRRKAPK
jgi:hypothetical protein